MFLSVGLKYFSPY